MCSGLDKYHEEQEEEALARGRPQGDCKKDDCDNCSNDCCTRSLVNRDEYFPFGVLADRKEAYSCMAKDRK